MPEATITRTQIITVNEVSQNSYGDLTFSDKDGKEYKVTVKRKPYFQKVVTPNAAIQLNYAMSSFGKEYIYSAVAVKDALPDPHKPESPPLQKGEDSPLVKEAVRLGGRVTSVDNTKNRAVAISYSKDLVCSGQIKLDQMSAYADKFLAYIENK